MPSGGKAKKSSELTHRQFAQENAWMIMVNEELQEIFFQETCKVFHFLEAHFGYQRPERKIISPEYPVDTAVLIRYVGASIGVQVLWGIADGFVGVILVELLQPGVFPKDVSLFPFQAQSRQARAVSLYDLADMLGHESDPDFLLKGVDNFRTRKRRMRTIESQLPEVLAGLARATRTYASSILQGDTSIFPEVMKFYVAKQKRLYPSMSLPPGVLDDPS